MTTKRTIADDTLVSEMISLPTRIRNALIAAGFVSVGDVRAASDKSLLALQNLGDRSIATLRKALGS